MPVGNAPDRLKQLYPTLGAYDKAIQEHGSQNKLGISLGIHRTTMSTFRKWLVKGSKPIIVKRKQINLDNDEIDKNIKALTQNIGYADVKVYRLMEGYTPGQMGEEGLEYLRTETSPTAFTQWSKGGARV